MAEETAPDPKAADAAAYRKALYAEADKLKVKYDKRWSDDRIESAIAAVGKTRPEPSEPAPIPAPPVEAAPTPEPIMTTQTPEEAEYEGLMAQADKLRISRTFKKGISAEGIREAIERHMAAGGQAKLILEAQAADKAAKGPADMVSVRVLKLGDNKISKGVHIPGAGDLRFRFGEIVKFDRKIALDLEGRGYAEIQDVVSAA